MSELTYLQAGVIGVLQGATELFPVSSLGHSVLVPALIGGSWQHLVTENASHNSEQSPYLAFIVALHVATAAALLVFFRSDWARLIRAFATTLRTRRIETSSQRLAWLIIVATIPVGLTGLALEHTFRTLFAKPLAVALFLTANGLILLAGERLRRRSEQRTQTAPAPAPDTVSVGAGAETAPAAITVPGRVPVPTQASAASPTGRAATRHARPRARGLIIAEQRTLDGLAYREAAVIGLFQTLALLAGISRSGITMVAGLLRGLDHEDAARFSFLLATPVILAAGLLKLPTLASHTADGIRGQVAFGALLAAIAAYLTTRFLVRYFQTRTLTPFAIYCLLAGAACTLRFTIG
ncbi:undecaprenyl-diphosphate phosphatase [Frankia sp. KB5]|uniref:undecaprenyl-diphosphate phosphatase n=1 Tax=Frankia sp. KB5 TaxID=683318 RepID=UPI000A25B7E2|nr:undecaprenyl-diphosphatase [Frankia sp. KB5]